MAQKNKYTPNNIQYIKYDAQKLNNREYMPVTSDSYTVRGVANEEDRIEKFKERLEAFKHVHTLKEARELLNKTMPIKLDRTTFYIGEAKCVIVNTDKRLRICFDTPKEFISFDFV